MKTSASKFLHRDASGDSAPEETFLDEAVAAESVGWDAQDPLVKFGVDMTELSDYLENIIQVVNQHG